MLNSAIVNDEARRDQRVMRGDALAEIARGEG